MIPIDIEGKKAYARGVLDAMEINWELISPPSDLLKDESLFLEILGDLYTQGENVNPLIARYHKLLDHYFKNE